MSERGMDALVVSDPANMYYLCGYNAWSFYMPQCVIVPAFGAPVLYARAMDAGGAQHTCVLPQDQITGYPEELVHRPDVHPMSWIASHAKERGLLPDGARVAVEGDAHFFSPRGYHAIAEVVGAEQMVDSNELVNWVRVVKSPAEQALLRIAAKTAQASMSVALDAVAPGRRQCDVAAEIVAAQTRGTPEHGGDYPSLVPMMPTGDAAGTPHLTWTDQPFETGEATTIELAGVYQRYHCPLSRTVMLGEPPARLRAASVAVTEGLQAALLMLVPGRTAHEVHAAFQRILTSHGLTKDSRIGYSIGIGYPPDWGEHTVSLRAGDRTELVAGMAFHLIVGMWMEGWGYEGSEPVIVQESGAERLTDLPQELVVHP